MRKMWKIIIREETKHKFKKGKKCRKQKKSKSEEKKTYLGNSMSSDASLDMTNLRIWWEFAKLLQDIRYDDPENVNLLFCTD